MARLNIQGTENTEIAQRRAPAGINRLDGTYQPILQEALKHIGHSNATRNKVDDPESTLFHFHNFQTDFARGLSSSSIYVILKQGRCKQVQEIEK